MATKPLKHLSSVVDPIDASMYVCSCLALKLRTIFHCLRFFTHKMRTVIQSGDIFLLVLPKDNVTEL